MSKFRMIYYGISGRFAMELRTMAIIPIRLLWVQQNIGSGELVGAEREGCGGHDLDRLSRVIPR